MVIYYLGNFLPSHSTEQHIARTLRNMGHQVIELQENFVQPDHLAQRLNTEEFTLFLFTRTWGETLKLDHLDILRKRKIPSVSYHLDLYVGLQRDGGIDTDPFQGVSSWTILRELFRRHVIDLQVAGFWLLLFGIILYKAGLL